MSVLRGIWPGTARMPREPITAKPAAWHAAARIGMKIIPLTLCVVLFFISASVPFLATPQFGNDDRLFAQLARNILRYGWLGPYNQLTLVKGPFYPLFLAVSSLSGLPFLAVQAALYGVCSIVLARVIGQLSRSRGIEFVTALALLLNPVLFELTLLRIARESVYVSLTMLVMALAIGCYNRRHATPVSRMLLSGATGLALAALWLTREEGVWILPPLLLMAVIHLAGFRSHGHRVILRELALLGVIAGTAAIGVGSVCIVNAWQYGVADAVEVKQTEFVAAYSALARIQQTDPRPHLNFPRSNLEQAYAVSPAAAELRSFLEGPNRAVLAQAGCGDDGAIIAPCDGEYRDSWFMWALRSATAAAGHYSTAREARAFYDRLAREVNAACDDGRLACRPSSNSLLPPLRWRDLTSASEAAYSMITMVVTLHGWWWQTNQWGKWWLPLPPVSCLGPDPLPVCRDDGWFFDIAHMPLFVTLTGSGGDPDYERSMQAGMQLPSVRNALVMTKIVYRVRLVFSAVLPWLSGLALVCFMIAGAMQLSRRRRNLVWLIAMVCASVIVSRIGALALISALWLYTVRMMYLAPVYPFLLAFCILAPVSLWRSVRAPQIRRDCGVPTSAP